MKQYKNLTDLNMNRKAMFLVILLFFSIEMPFYGKNSNKVDFPTLKVDGLVFEDLNRNGLLDLYEDYRKPIELRVKDLLSKLTTEEKTKLVNGIGMPGFDAEKMQFTPGADQGKVPGAAGGTFAIERLGIPSIIVADGPAGLRINPKRNNSTDKFYATAFPVGTALASSWNKQLIYEVGKAIGSEVKAYGVDILLGPGMNIHRNPLCGRNFEYYSEDPYLTGKIAAEMVKGVQSNGVGTSLKHFAANNQETNRMGLNVLVSERAMREIYLRGFEITVKESNPWTIMSSYNSINGTFASARKDLLTTILREEWGFKGLVMTDWFGGFNGMMSPFSPDSNTDVTKQLTAGNDLLMPGLPKQQQLLLDEINNGKIKMEDLNLNVERVLNLILQSPTMNKIPYSNKPNLTENAKIARDAAAEGIILLKNNNKTLPYTSKKGTIAVFGVTSYEYISGGTGSGDVNEAYTISLIDGLKNVGFKIDQELQKKYQPYAADLKDKELKRREKEGGILATPKRLLELELSPESINKSADLNSVAIITIGRNAGESGDRPIEDDFLLAEDEKKLINSVSESFRKKGKKVIVILNIGGVIETQSWQDKVDAILLPWQSGQESGNAVIDVLSGKVNPSGKLTMTIPVQYDDLSTSKNFIQNPNEVKYKEGIYVGYRYFDTFKVKTAYEFGFGMSYTTFQFSNLTIDENQFTDKVIVSITIKNTGKSSGKEVVQLYLSAPNTKIDKPIRELKAFSKTKNLKPGEQETITFTLDSKDLASFHSNQNAWIAEAGEYNVYVGSSSKNCENSIPFSLSNDIIVEKLTKTFIPELGFSDLNH